MAAEAPSQAGVCPPCRGTGQVVSQPEGKAEKVTCPWCGGTGRRPPAAERPADD